MSEEKYVFKPVLLLVLMLRGALEFSGSILYLVCLNIALNEHINQGICSAMITMAGLMICILSYFAYGEKLNIPQVVGIICVLVAVTFMGIF